MAHVSSILCRCMWQGAGWRVAQKQEEGLEQATNTQHQQACVEETK